MRGRPLPGDVGPAFRIRRDHWALLTALAAVAITFGATVVRVLSEMDESFRYAGDQAAFGLAVHEANSFDRDLGPYSRYVWSHPGPLWFYLLAPASRLFGGHDAALVASNVLLNGALAAAVVVAVSRAHRAALTLGVTTVVLLFVLRMPPTMFVDAWSPFVLLLGTLLFLVLAARVHSGSWPALLAMLLAGSFLVQTHVGTVPLVAIVGATAGIAFVLAHRDRRTTAGAADGGDKARRRPDRRAVALTVLLVAVWVPPVVQQLSSPLREGNLVRLVSFLLHHEDDGEGPTILQAPVAVARLLAMAPYGWGPGPWETRFDDLSPSLALILAAQLAASVGLLVLGVRWGSRTSFWWGAVTLAALTAAVVSAATVTGVLFWYLIIWVAVLPAATAIGVVHLALDRRASRRDVTSHGRTALDRAPVLPALGVVVLAGSVVAAVSLGGAVADLPDSTEVAEVSRLVDDALADVDGRLVHVDMAPHELWPIGAGLIRGLVSDGWTVTVDPEFADIFGSRRAEVSGGPVDVLLLSTSERAYDRIRDDAAVRELGVLETAFGPVSVLIRVENR